MLPRSTAASITTALLLAGCGSEQDDVRVAARPEAASSTVQSSEQDRAGHERMLALLREIAARTPDEHHYQGDRRARELRQQVRDLGTTAPWKTWLDLGIAEVQLGNERAGVEVLAKLQQHLADGTMAGGAAGLREVAFHLGLGWLRVAETENCCHASGPENCIVPIRGSGVHSKTEGSTNARKWFLEALASTPEHAYAHLAARWLLNIACMTLGRWPDEVPERYRIPASAFAPEVEFPRFANVAGRLGLDTFDLAGGVIADEFDGDGCLDLVVSTWDTDGQLRLWHNERDGTFADRTEAAGLTGLLGGLNMVQADYDNDGDLDFLVLRGAWLFEHGRHPNSLVRNDGDGTFTDVTFAAGLGEVHYPTQTAGWADYDNDGDLDLFVGNESSKKAPFPCQLFRNDGDGRFTDVAVRAGVENFEFAKGVAWGDYDGDRWPDLYVSNNGAPNRLYRNQRDGTFADVAGRLGVTRPLVSFPTWFWDYDNDGALDLFVSAYVADIGHLAAWHLKLPVGEYEKAVVYRGDGRGGFRDVTQELGLDQPTLPMGCNFGDLDNDGWLDFYLGTGNPNLYALTPNVMYWNRQGKRFQDVTMAGGFGHLQKGHGVAFADLDNDGDQDVFEQMGGAYAGDGARSVLFENPGSGNHWLAVQLVGTRSNRSAIGARICIEFDDGGAARRVWRHVGSGGSFGCNPLRQHVGLGQAARARRIEVFWPTTGLTQVVEDVAADRAIRITEGREGCEPIALPRLTWRR